MSYKKPDRNIAKKLRVSPAVKDRHTLDREAKKAKTAAAKLTSRTSGGDFPQSRAKTSVSGSAEEETVTLRHVAGSLYRLDLDTSEG